MSTKTLELPSLALTIINYENFYIFMHVFISVIGIYYSWITAMFCLMSLSLLTLSYSWNMAGMAGMQQNTGFYSLSSLSSLKPRLTRQESQTKDRRDGAFSKKEKACSFSSKSAYNRLHPHLECTSSNPSCNSQLTTILTQDVWKKA